MNIGYIKRESNAHEPAACSSQCVAQPGHKRLCLLTLLSCTYEQEMCKYSDFDHRNVEVIQQQIHSLEVRIKSEFLN